MANIVPFRNGPGPRLGVIFQPLARGGSAAADNPRDRRNAIFVTAGDGPATLATGVIDWAGMFGKPPIEGRPVRSMAPYRPSRGALAAGALVKSSSS
jgi:hypothetical protein